MSAGDTSVENKDFDRRGDRPLVRMLAVALGIGVVMFVLAAGMIAMLGLPAGQSSFAAASVGDEPLETFVGIAPVAYLVQRIGDPYVRIDVLVQAGQDPHIFEPTPRQVIRLSQARLFFRVGLPFEDRLIERVEGSPARFTIVDATAGIKKRPSRGACPEACSASSDTGPLPGAEGDDDEGGTDPHVWLSPRLLRTMAANVAAALSQTDPRHESYYRSNFKALDAQLDALDRRIARSLAPYRGQAFYVFHPAFGYFADTYGLRQVSVEVEGKTPTPRQVFDLVRQARADRVKIIFLQPQFNQQIAASIALAIQGAVMPMDDLAFDVVGNLADIAEKVGRAANVEKPMEPDANDVPRAAMPQ